MGVQIVNIVPVEGSLELGVGRTGEEVQAAVETQDVVSLLNNGLNGSEANHIVVAGAAGQAAQVLSSVLHTGVDVVQLDAVLSSLFYGVDGSSALQTSFVDIGDDQQAGTAIAVDSVVDSSQTHGANGCQQSHLAAFLNAHLVDIGTGLGVVHGVESTDNAAQRLSQRAVVVGIGVVGQQAVFQQSFDGNIGILGVAAAVVVGVAGSHLAAVVEVSGLDGELVANLVLVCPICADSDDVTAELVAYDGGIFGYVVGDTLVIFAFQSCLVGRHTSGVTDNTNLNVVRTNLGQGDLVQTQVILAVDSYCFCIHN